LRRREKRGAAGRAVVGDETGGGSSTFDLDGVRQNDNGVHENKRTRLRKDGVDWTKMMEGVAQCRIDGGNTHYIC
jgi:hypothetical protein